MNVLMISLDRTLFTGKEKAVGDAQDRHIKYGELVSNLFIVVYSPRDMKLKSKKLSDNVFVYPACHRNAFSYLWNSYTIAKKLCEKNRIDLIVTQDPLTTGLVGYLLKRKYEIPILMHLHGDYIDNKYWLKESFINPCLNKLGKWLLKKADGIRVVSSGIKKQLINKGIPKNRVYVVPTPVNLSKFSEFSATELHKIRQKYLLEEGKVVLFVGRLSKEKNIPNLLKAASIVISKYSNTKFLICGDGDERGNLERISQKLGIEDSVIFLGNIPHDDLPNYYRTCDFFVLPSDHEGFGKVLLEAAMAEKPAVATNLPGPLDIVVNHKTGFLIPPRNHEQLAQKLTELIENPEFAITMGKNAKKHVMKNFDNEKNIQKIVNMWEEVILMGKRMA